nr:hypothetical protein [Tanacetum cinerariifolium]
MGITIDCGPIETGVKHLFGGVVWAMMSPGGSIMASLKNISGFLAVNTPPDDLIRTDFKQEGVVLKVMLHVFEEFVLLLGRHPFHNKFTRMVLDSFFITDGDIKFLKEENPLEQSRLGILLVKKTGYVFVLNGGDADWKKSKGLSSSNSFGVVPIASPSLSLFHNDPYMKVLQAFYAKESPIPPSNPITPPVILTPSLVLLPSPLFDPRYFFVLEEVLPPKKQIYPPYSSSTTLSNSSQKQAYILVPPSFSTYTPTPPPIYELGKSSIKMCVKHHEEQVESILNYLKELSFHRIEKMEQILVNGWIIIPRDFDEVKAKLKETHTQIRELQKKRVGQSDKITFIHFRSSNLEMTLEDIQDRHQLYMKNHMGHTL